MNNLVKQQGCAGSGVTGFIPTGRLFSYQRGEGKETRICCCWKGDLRLPTCIPHSVSLVLLPQKPQHSLFIAVWPSYSTVFPWCMAITVSENTAISVQADWYHTQRTKRFASFLECKTCEKNKTVLQKGVTRQADHKEMGESALYHNILCSATALSSHPFRHQGMQVRGSWKAHMCITQGLWFHTLAVGVCIPTPRKTLHIEVVVFLQTKWLSCSAFFFFRPEICTFVMRTYSTSVSQKVVFP